MPLNYLGNYPMWNKIKSKPLLKNFILAFLTAAIIVILTLLWLRIYTNHGEKIETPNFMGLTIEEAMKLADENNLRYSVDSVYASKPKNTIILQNPLPFSDSIESWVKRDRFIYLTVVRKLEQKIKLPSIVDNSKSLASTKLTISGLNPSWTYKASPYKDVVMDVKYKGKSVKAGFILPKGSKVEVIVGKGMEQSAQVQIPNLVGKTINEANIELGSKSFQLTEIYNNCMTKADSLVAKIVQQSPDYMDGKTIAEGSEIIVIANK